MKVLLAEDSPVMRRLLSSYLQSWGFDVDEASDGQQAWERYQSTEYSLVLTDWMMPEMDGMELIRRIREVSENRFVYVVLLTQKTEQEDLVKAMDSGADDYLAKPFHREELRVRLNVGRRMIDMNRRIMSQSEELNLAHQAIQQADNLVLRESLDQSRVEELFQNLEVFNKNLDSIRTEIAHALKELQEYRNHLADFSESELGGLEDADFPVPDYLPNLEELKQRISGLFISSGQLTQAIRSSIEKLAHLEPPEN